MKGFLQDHQSFVIVGPPSVLFYYLQEILIVSKKKKDYGKSITKTRQSRFKDNLKCYE